MGVLTQANDDYFAALKIARHHWPEDTDPAVIQAATATVLIHIKELRKAGPSAPQAAQSRPAGPGRAAPASAGPVPPCPTCGGPAWDNRKQKKNPKAPDFRCKDKNCLDDEGRVTAWWVEKKGNQNTAYAERVAREPESFDKMPAALQDDDDDLPF